MKRKTLKIFSLYLDYWTKWFIYLIFVRFDFSLLTDTDLVPFVSLPL